MSKSPGAESARPRIGVFGGTFDPPHEGHVQVAREVADALDLERVVWIPAAQPPHKPAGATAPADVRIEMVRAAVEADRRFEVGTWEVERGGPSFTVDTLDELASAHPGSDLFLIMGEDQYRDFESWRSPSEIRARAHLVVMDRAGRSGRAAPGRTDSEGGRGVTFVPVRRIDVSSSAIREAVGAGGDIGPWVPPGVARIIERAGLYRS